MFFEEFGSYLETIILSPESLILTGDYNFHVDVEGDPDARAFQDLLASMGLKQHVNVPTHVRGTQRGYSSKPLNIALLKVF